MWLESGNMDVRWSRIVGTGYTLVCILATVAVLFSLFLGLRAKRSGRSPTVYVYWCRQIALWIFLFGLCWVAWTTGVQIVRLESPCEITMYILGAGLVRLAVSTGTALVGVTAAIILSHDTSKNC